MGQNQWNQSFNMTKPAIIHHWLVNWFEFIQRLLKKEEFCVVF